MDRPRCPPSTLRNPYTKNCVQCESVKAPKGDTRTQKQVLTQWTIMLGLPAAGKTIKELCAQLLTIVRTRGQDLDVLLFDADRRDRVSSTDPQEIAARQKASRAIEAARQIVGDDESAARALEAMLSKVNLGQPTEPRAAAEPIVRRVQAPAVPDTTRQPKRRVPEADVWQAPGSYTNDIEPDMEVVVGNNGDATALFQGGRIKDFKGVRKLWQTSRGSYVLRTDDSYYYIGYVQAPDGTWKRHWYQFQLAPNDKDVTAITKQGVMISNENVYLLEFRKRLNKAQDWANFAFWYVDNYDKNNVLIQEALSRGAPNI